MICENEALGSLSAGKLKKTRGEIFSKKIQ